MLGVGYFTLSFKTLLQSMHLKLPTQYKMANIDMVLKDLTRRMENGLMWKMKFCALIEPQTITLYHG